MPLDLQQLLDLDSPTLRQSLESAIAIHISPTAIQPTLDQIIARLDELRDQQLISLAEQALVQLIDRQTNLPLDNHTVKFYDLETGTAAAELGFGISNAQGITAVNYTVMRHRRELDNAAATPHRLRLVILTPENQQIDQVEIAVNPSQPAPLPVMVSMPPAPEPPTHGLIELGKTLQRNLSANLLDALVAKGIRTLGDIRRAGGIRQIPGLPVPAINPDLNWLESHANLTLLSSDVRINEALLEKGYPTVASIAQTPNEDFVNSVQPEISKAQATQMQVMARAQIDYLNHLLTQAQVEPDEQALFGGPALQRGRGLLEQSTGLGCEDCLSAVSPLAYLSDLLNYAVNHLRDNGKRIDLNWLTTTLRQPFAQLPVACNALTYKVRQVRLAVEVLREYLKSFTLNEAQVKTLLTAERDYLSAAYTSLLGQIGTSFEELRLTRSDQNTPTATTEPKRELADRLGIAPDRLDILLLAGVAIVKFNTVPPVPLHALEQDLKNLFAALQIPKTINLSANSQPQIAAAQLLQEALEIIFGLESTYARNLSGELPPSKLQQWRREYQRSLWFAQDHPADPYQEELAEALKVDLLPAIDPDLIGPDDLRIPLDAKEQPVWESNPAFVMWRERRQAVDRRLAALANARQTAEQQEQEPFAALWQATYASPMPDIEALLMDLLEGVPQKKEQAQARIQALHLSVDSFTRFTTLSRQDRLARRQPDPNDRLTAEEWSEIDSILTQAWKAQQFPGWRKQESERKITLGGELFWLSASDPVVGAWSATPPVQQPAIDPEEIKWDELPDPTAGSVARRLWRSRQTELQQIRNDLQETYRAGGFDAMRQKVFGQAQDLAKLQKDLNSSDPQVVELAEAVITEELCLSIAGFLRLMAIQAKPMPTAAELNEVYYLLAAADKVKNRYSAWLQEERQAGLNPGVYWLARKARLPRWRAGPENRQQWRQALQNRLQAPFIDPDLIDGGHFAKPKGQNPAYPLYRARRAWIKEQLQNLQTRRALAGKNLLSWFDATLASIVGVPGRVLLALRAERDHGYSIGARLQQLTLSTDAFETLLRVRALLETNGGVIDSDWDDIDSILTQVEKQRKFAVWRAEERRQRIILSGDFFKLPNPAPLQPSSPELRRLSEWRASPLDLQNWEGELRSRFDRDLAISQSLREATGLTEEQTLPTLRNALIAAAAVDAKGLTERLLLDFQNGGKQLTTRISQAIETVQGLLWSVQTAQLQDDYPNLKLIAANFDQEWRWLGSYATWRAAMLVFLYPENVSAPNLQRWKTPAFKALLDSADRLTAEKAKRQAGDYASYLWNISAPSREESAQAVGCHAKTRVLTTPRGDDLPEPRDRLLYFLFAQSNGAVYWSAYDRKENSDYKQYPWMKTPGLDKLHVVEIIGAMPNYFGGYLYLFVKTIDSQLRYVRFDLLQPGKWLQDRWESQARSLSLPPKSIGDSIKIVNNLDDRPSDNGFQPPRPIRLAFKQMGATDRVYTWTLNLAGTGWETDGKETSHYLGSGIPTVLAVFEISGSKLFITQDSAGLWIKRHKPGSSTGAFTIDIQTGSRAALSWIGAEYDISGSAARIHLFYRHNQTKKVRQRVFALGANQFVGPIYISTDDWLKEVAPSYGYARSYEKRILWKHPFQVNNSTYFSYRHESHTVTNHQMIFPYGPTIAPWTPLKTLTGDIVNLKKYRDDVRHIVLTNDSPSEYFIHEAYFLVPIYIALKLQANGQYVAALDWFRLIYDYSAPVWDRKVYYGLVSEESLTINYQRRMDWLLDPLDPHAIAATRRNTYTRYTLQALIRCLLDYADDEFARDTAESVPRARTLYMTALELLDSYELKQNVSDSSEIIGLLKVDLSHAPDLVADWNDILADLYRIRDRAALKETVDRIGEILGRNNEPLEDRLAKAQDLATAAVAKLSTSTSSDDLATVLSGQGEKQNQAYAALLAQPTVFAAAAQVGAKASQITTQIVENRSGGISTLSFGFCIPPNPVVNSLRLRAELNLFKLRTGRNIAGVERQIEPYAVDINAESGLPVIGSNGQLALPGALAIDPTPYRYALLVERAKQLVQLAATVEAAMLSAIEKRDTELYNILKARQDIRLSEAHVQLQDLRVTEAEQGVDLAKLQQSRAQLQVNHFAALLKEGQSKHERDVLEYLNDAVDRYASVAKWATVSAIGGGLSGAASGAQQGASIWALAGPVGAVIGGILGGIGGGVTGSASGFGAKASARAAQASTRSQIAAVNASYERRTQEWEFQQSLAQKDIAIGGQQILLARERVRIVGQERAIAEIQTEHAEDVLNFLNTKFTNAELYDWMSEVLERVYRFFLRQATAMARLAANQLAFERQEAPPAFIQADYWETPLDGAAGGASNGRNPDRRGLTGSARLLQDVYQLDQYAFETDKRKLQIVKTISLSRLDPFAFQRFRESGVFPFATPMELFDRDFPGHYLRLIKRVRTSVIALIPPTDGVHASLSTTGLSRVVIGGNSFQSIVVRRDPETVALSSPISASGLFELDSQADLLYPFEGMGVDTMWEFRLPKAANPFDYRTIADVLITIEYTALNSFDYRPQVIQSLRPALSADRPFGFRDQFPDQWYDLHNPDQTNKPLTIKFKTVREDFPPNLDGLRIEHIVMYFARSTDADFDQVPVSGFYFQEDGGAGKVGGAATSIDDVISTRRGNAGSWTAMIGKSPFGEWELTLPDTAQTRELFVKEQLEDILFVITYSGGTPNWPV